MPVHLPYVELYKNSCLLVLSNDLLLHLIRKTAVRVQIISSARGFENEKVVATIGSFDGVHRGHRMVVESLKNAAAQCGGKSAVITLSPHPAVVLHPDRQVFLLSTLEEKSELLAATGIDYMVVLPFTKQLAQTTYSDFVREYLVNKLHISKLLVGYDNKMGHNGEGRFTEIEQFAVRIGLEVEQLSLLPGSDIPVSSTAIRGKLAEGDVIAAADMLGYQYGLTGKVVHGNNIGTTIGYPTANLQPDANKFIPRRGVYIISAIVGGHSYPGMLNIGMRPTIAGAAGSQTIEAHLFGYSGNLYGTNLTIKFVDRLRDERQFSSIDELKKQLRTDAERALSLCANINA